MLAPNVLLQDRYRIIRLLSQGGMGAVYLASDIRLDNEVALKETFFSGGSAELREQFHREARLLSRLRHPALPRVIDHFIDGNGQFLVMDYIAGQDLEGLLQANKGPFPIYKVLDWAEQLLDVLHYLHTQDEPVIHRDIKPANVKLTPQGRVILLDFGLAKGSSASLRMSFRAATPAYAPLEQIMFQGTDARSDLYSLAVTLYHLMTGELPPIAYQRRETVWKGLPDPFIPPNKLNPQVPAGIAGVLTRAMSLQADDRPSSAAEMLVMLHSAIQAMELERQAQEEAFKVAEAERQRQVEEQRKKEEDEKRRQQESAARKEQLRQRIEAGARQYKEEKERGRQLLELAIESAKEEAERLRQEQERKAKENEIKRPQEKQGNKLLDEQRRWVIEERQRRALEEAEILDGRVPYITNRMLLEQALAFVSRHSKSYTGALIIGLISVLLILAASYFYYVKVWKPQHQQAPAIQQQQEVTTTEQQTPFEQAAPQGQRVEETRSPDDSPSAAPTAGNPNGNR